MQNWYKNIFVDATVLFELPFMQIWTVLSNRSDTGFEPELLASQVLLRTPRVTEQTYCLWKPIDMKLDMCDANVQKHQFSNLIACHSMISFKLLCKNYAFLIETINLREKE